MISGCVKDGFPARGGRAPGGPWFRGALALGWGVLVAAGAVAGAIYTPLGLVLGRVDGAHALQWVLTLLFAVDLFVHIPRGKPAAPAAAGGQATWRACCWLAGDLLAAVPFFLCPVAPGWQLLRLLKLARVAEQMGRWRRSQAHNPNLVRLALCIFWLILSSHWLACGWLALRGVAGDLSLADNYIRALYWCITTLATVGYGDIIPATSLERLYAMLVMILGIGVFGYVIGNAAGLLANLDPARVRHREVMESITAFMRYRRAPPELQQRVLDYYGYLWEKRLGFEELEAVAALPPSLKAAVALFLNGEIIEKVPLFHEAGEEFIREVALELRPVVFMPDDIIMRAGERGEEMYFISQGTVAILSPDKQVVYRTLTVGDYFGEMALLTHQTRTATVRAMGYCDLYMLTRNALARVLARHPHVAARIHATAAQRQRDDPRPVPVPEKDV